MARDITSKLSLCSKKLDQQEPNLDLVQYYLGNSYSENGELDAALTYYKKAIALNPNQASYYAALAKLFRKQRRRQDGRG